jgi:enoyl-CoA hydratase/carnithine racemase
MILEREQHGLVQVLRLNRPEAANSLNPELLRELGRAFHESDTDDSTQVLVLTGAGERIFCAGMDLRAFSESEGPGGGNEGSGGGSGGSTGTAGTDAEAPASFNFKDLPAKPVIAAVNGAAVGGGFELALACDLVVAADTARFGLPEVKRGLFPGGGGTLLGTRLPLSLALELNLTGELIDAQRAESWGLVNRVVPPEDLLTSAIALAQTIAANGPLATRMIKDLVRRAVIDDPKRGWATPEEFTAVFTSEDAKEGAMAFLEKRPANWKGR